MIIFFLVISIAFSSCLSLSQGFNDYAPYAKSISKIINAGYELNGKKNVVVNGKKFPNDCSGLVYGVYSAAEIEIQKYLSAYRGNGVERMFRYYDELGLIHKNKMPTPGDLVFWDNTYDKNSDGIMNDYLTHVGIVMDVDLAGNIKVLHYFTGKGIEIDNMNLYYENVSYITDDNGKVVKVNDYMRYKKKKTDPYLASQLFRCFAKAYKID